MVFVAGLYNVLSLPWVTVRLGLVLAGLVIIYIASLHLLGLKSTVHKELLAAIIYSFGVFVAPLSLLKAIDTVVILVFIAFFLIVMANLLLFPLFEEESDRKDQLQSVVTVFGRTVVRRLAAITLSFSIVSIVILGLSEEGSNWLSACFVLLAMIAVLAAVWIWPAFFKKNNRYRWVGDGIFLLPLVYLLLL
jgi:4-hydroxybenzoate polyprenyltransferase